jgi:hypothetical protein
LFFCHQLSPVFTKEPFFGAVLLLLPPPAASISFNAAAPVHGTLPVAAAHGDVWLARKELW